MPELSEILDSLGRNFLDGLNRDRKSAWDSLQRGIAENFGVIVAAKAADQVRTLVACLREADSTLYGKSAAGAPNNDPEDKKNPLDYISDAWSLKDGA
jgi:hypothetical protein